MMTKVHGSLAGVLILFLLNGVASGQDAEPAPTAEPVERKTLGSVELYKEVLFATALIVREDGGHGTAWVIDEEKCLLVTNHHVVAGNDKVHVYFPSREQSTTFSPSVKVFAQDEIPLVGRVIDSRPDKDLAIIITAALPKRIHALPLAAKDDREKIQGGVAVKSVGNPGESLWDNLSGEVRQVRRLKTRYANGQSVDLLAFEVTSPINPGDSGGAVVNSKGEVIGVVSAVSRAETLRGYIIHVDELHDYIDEVRPWLQPTEAEQFQQRGQNYLDKERFTLALRDFNRAIDLDDDPAMYYCCRGEAYYKLRNYDKAAADLAKALQRDHELAPAYNIRGRCYLQDGEFDNANDDFDKAIEIDSKFSLAFEGKARVALAKRDYAAAIEHLGDAIRHEPDVASYYDQRGLAHYTKASTEEKDQAAYVFRRMAYFDFTDAIDLGGQVTEYLLHRANTCRDLQWYADAEKDYDAAIESNPKDSNIYRQRGLMSQSRRLFDRALADFQKSLNYTEQDRDKAILYVDLGNTHLLSGNDDEAKKLFQRAAGINPRAQARRLKNLTPYTTRKLFVANRSNQPIRFYVLFYANAGNNNFIWFPGAQDSDEAHKAEYYILEPGELKQPIYSLTGSSPFPISARKIRIWGVGETDGKRYDQHQFEDMFLADEKEYKAAAKESFVYIFDDN